MPNQFVCVIPARYKSSRFPGKPLALINGKPMILWVLENASASKYCKEVIVATDSNDIYSTVDRAGYKVIMTSEDCPNGSARVAEVAKKYKDTWFFEMQGDQPLVTSDVINNFIEGAVSAVSHNSNIQVVIPYSPTTTEQIKSPDVLKVVVTSSQRLVFQTRQPIQSGFRTLGLYLWRSEVLQKFAKTPVSQLEKSEDSHPVRLYVNDVYVQGFLIQDSKWIEVDRPEHIEQVEEILQSKTY